MKFQIIVSVLMMSMYMCSADVNQTCSWQLQRNNLIKSLTPAGQSTVNTILLDLQYITGAAIQPIFGYLQNKYAAAIGKITNSTDNANLNNLGKFLGFNNPKIGSPPLWFDFSDYFFIYNFYYKTHFFLSGIYVKMKKL